MKRGSACEHTPQRQLRVALQASVAAALAEELGVVGRCEYEPAHGNLTWSAQTHRIFGTAVQGFSPSLQGFLAWVMAEGVKPAEKIDSFAFTMCTASAGWPMARSTLAARGRS